MFADSSGWATLVDRRQPYHVVAAALVKQAHAAGPTITTTNYVLAELTALLNSPLRIPRPRQIQFLTDLRTVSWVDVVPIDSTLEALAWHLWASRPDKEWTLVDCASFVVMQQRGLTEALTTDHHFEQAGFIRLLK
jgi:predicted nucleic acid-binding protein